MEWTQLSLLTTVPVPCSSWYRSNDLSDFLCRRIGLEFEFEMDFTHSFSLFSSPRLPHIRSLPRTDTHTLTHTNTSTCASMPVSDVIVLYCILLLLLCW